jgi:hypothetical protein
MPYLIDFNNLILTLLTLCAYLLLHETHPVCFHSASKSVPTTMPRLGRRAIDALQPEAGDFFVRDNQIAEFGVRVMPSGAKTYPAQYRKGGRTRRVSLGRHGKITVDVARRLAKDVMGQVPMGETPAENIAQDRRANRCSAL